MNIREQALLIPCAGELLPAIVAWPVAGRHGGSQQTTNCDQDQAGLPDGAANGQPARLTADDRRRAQRAACGVLIVVGGPQYRVGSHRQFLLLARRLAGAGYPAMRFDYRGMGDAGGAMRGFEEVSTDIAAAIDAFQSASPALQRVVLWGLCDAASAALLYVQASRDPRIAGLALLNPWVRSEVSLAQTHIKHYYGQRLLQGEFWRKLLSGRLEVVKSLRALLASAMLARRSRAPGKAPQRHRFQERMAEGWREFPGRLLLILSGQDYTAKEFLEFAGSDPAWSGLVDAAKVRRVDLAEADHTFSSRTQRAQVEDATLAWLDTVSEVLETAPTTGGFLA
ncbi:hydrolase 1, exosortase A system-associated [Accumulibacter sp.]|uniref:hydrolase 1, exosortase A system-associated n=1 Tax=Accumulibacter sp. TaxID=2053492 RepID=UPI001ACC9CA9|nr:hydrolase 1, exosortase A system-associated [Accumulibacter sp.]MBN8514161.1 hydrolase 1, exosortase A system-associated [Accumulibacter sp.]MBO3702224.1 hydrolase 1, exosortase A system-associated [Accumulibacter sp.]